MNGPGQRGRTLLYLAGSNWSGVAGTDRSLAEALATHVGVTWVEPPMSVVGRARMRRGTARPASEPGPALPRIDVTAPLGVTRPGIRTAAAFLTSRTISRAVRRRHLDVAAVVLANPHGRFPRGVPGTKIYYVTDDWIAGAALMGASADRIRATMAANLAAADVVAAVSPHLIKTLAGVGLPATVPVTVIPNGCRPLSATAGVDRPADLPAGPLVGLFGQINERLDLSMLDAVARLPDTTLLIVGPRTDRDQSFGRQLDRMLARDSVCWLGGRAPSDLPGYLRACSVGITPYADTVFNRGSFPIKTLEYLASGLRVVSTDSPAVRWLDTSLIDVAPTADRMAELVRQAMTSPQPESEMKSRQEFAARHSWDARALSLLASV